MSPQPHGPQHRQHPLQALAVVELCQVFEPPGSASSAARTRRRRRRSGGRRPPGPPGSASRRAPPGAPPLFWHASPPSPLAPARWRCRGVSCLPVPGSRPPVHPYAVRDDLPRFVFSGLYACHTVLSLLPALAGPGLPPGGDGVCSRGKSLASRRGAGAGTRWGRLRGPGPGRLSPRAGPKAHSSIPGKGEGCQNLGKPGFGNGKGSPQPGR